MSMHQCCIIVVAEGIGSEIVDRFISSVRQSNPMTDTSIEIFAGAEKAENAGFRKSAGLNYLLRKSLENYSVVIQTDIDLLVPPGLIDHSFNSVVSHERIAYHHYLRHVWPTELEGKQYEHYNFKEWQTRKGIFCSGCWNAMNGKTWKLSGGWNEDMIEWGYEDTEFLERTKARGIRWIVDSQFGLVHVNHPPRTKRNVQANRVAAAKYDSARVDWLTGKLPEKRQK